MLLPKAKPEFELAPLLCRDRARASDAAFIAVKVVNQAKEPTFCFLFSLHCAFNLCTGLHINKLGCCSLATHVF